jgi:hypothetical protein
MTESRVVITGADDATKLSLIAKALNVGQQGNIYSGYGSIGSVVEDSNGEQRYLRIPHVDNNGNTATEVLEAYQRSGTEGVLKVIAIDSQGNMVECAYDPDNPDWGICREPEELLAVAMIMEVLPSAPSLSQIVNEADHDQTIKGYELLAHKLNDLHHTPVALSRDQNLLWVDYSLKHPIYGRERLLAIKPYINFDEGWVSEDTYEHIRQNLELIAQDMLASDISAVRVHGDAWRDNVLIVDNRAILFDNAIKYGIAGNDVGFAIGDRVLVYLVNNDLLARESVESFFNVYGEDVLSDVFLAMGFKAVVGAAFDNYDIEDRSRIIRWIEKILLLKVADKELSFSFDLAKQVWDEV